MHRPRICFNCYYIMNSLLTAQADFIYLHFALFAIWKICLCTFELPVGTHRHGHAPVCIYQNSPKYTRRVNSAWRIFFFFFFLLNILYSRAFTRAAAAVGRKSLFVSRVCWCIVTADSRTSVVRLRFPHISIVTRSVYLVCGYAHL